MFNIAGAVGTIFGPIIGGLLNDSVGFQSTCDVLALSALVSGIIYFFLGILPTLIKKSKSADYQEIDEQHENIAPGKKQSKLKPSHINPHDSEYLPVT